MRRAPDELNAGNPPVRDFDPDPAESGNKYVICVFFVQQDPRSFLRRYPVVEHGNAPGNILDKREHGEYRCRIQYRRIKRGQISL